MENLHELVKIGLRPRVSFAVWVTVLIVLVVPLPDFLNVDEFVAKYDYIIKFVGLFAFVYWIIEAAIFGWQALTNSWALDSENKAILSHIETLNGKERKMLQSYIEKGQQTIRWRTDLGETASLADKGLIVPVPNLHQSPGDMAEFTMPRFVWDHLKKPEIQSLLTENPSDKS